MSVAEGLEEYLEEYIRQHGFPEAEWSFKCEDLKNVPMIGEGLAWFCEALTDFWNIISQLPSILSQIPKHIQEFVTGFPNWLFDAISGGIISIVRPMFYNVEEWILEEVSDLLETSQLYVINPEAASSIATASSVVAPAGGRTREIDLFNTIISYFSPYAGLAEAILRGVFEYEPPATPEKARLALARYMTVNFWLGTAPTVALSVIDMFHPIKQTWLPEIARSFYFGLGLNWMTWTVWSQVMRHTILNPLEIYYAERYRSNWPSRSEFEEWYRKRVIGRERFRDGLAKLGYADEFIDYFEKVVWKDIPESTLADLFEYNVIDQNEFIERLKRLGYSDEDATIVFHRHLLKLYAPHKEATKSLIIRAYKLGLLPREEAIQRLIQIGYRREVAELELRVVETEELQDLKELQIKIVLEDLKDGYITIDDCTKKLTELGVPAERAELMCRLEYARRRSTLREKITKADIHALFDYGLIDRDTAIEWLKRLGYSAEVAEDIVKVWELKQLEEQKKLSRSLIERAYKLGILPREAAKQKLVQLGYTDEAAELILQIIDTQEHLDLLEIKQKIVLEDLKDGYISKDEAVEKLKQLGVSEDVAKALVELTLARKRVERRERYTKADVRAMFIHGMITKDEAIDMLVNLGYAKPVAEALVKIWEAESAEKPRELTTSQILRAYSLGLISRDEAKKMLMSLGYPETYAELLIKMEEAKELQELQEDRIRLVLEDLKDGVITKDEAISLLRKFGVSEERARILVELTLAKKRVERRERLTKGDIHLLFRHGLVSSEDAIKMLIEIGYAESVAKAIVRAWEMELSEEPRKLTVSQILRLYRTGIISRDEAKNMLLDLGYTEHSAELLLKLEDAQIHADLVELQQKIILEDLKDGYIDADTAVRLLVQAGVSEEKAKLLVQLQLARIRGPERPRVTVSRIEKWFKLGLLDEETAKEWLKRLGYTDEIIEMFLKEWKAEQHPETRGLSTSQILRAYRLGVLDRMMAKNYLISLGYSDDAAELLLRIEDAREIQDILEERARAVLLRFRYGIIDEEAAKKQLMDLGLAPPRIEALLELEKARRERPPRPRRLTPSQVLRACREGIFDIKKTDEYLRELGYYNDEDRLVLIYMYCYQYIAGGEQRS